MERELTKDMATCLKGITRQMDFEKRNIRAPILTISFLFLFFISIYFYEYFTEFGVNNCSIF